MDKEWATNDDVFDSAKLSPDRLKRANILEEKIITILNEESEDTLHGVALFEVISKFIAKAGSEWQGFQCYMFVHLLHERVGGK